MSVINNFLISWKHRSELSEGKYFTPALSSHSWVEASNTPPRCGGSSRPLGTWAQHHRVSLVPRGALQIRIRFVRQKSFLPLKQTNKQHVPLETIEYDYRKTLASRLACLVITNISYVRAELSCFMEERSARVTSQSSWNSNGKWIRVQWDVKLNEAWSVLIPLIGDLFKYVSKVVA